MFDLVLVVVTTKAVTLTFGTILTWLSYRAFRRTGAPALRALAVGIGLVTVGAVLGGAVHQLLEMPILIGVSIQSVFTAAGFALLTYSLYVDEAPDHTTPSPGTVRTN
jgi:hypothetical protein